MTDELSILLGSTLVQVMLIGAVVVAMKMALVGRFVLAGGVLFPLVGAAYLFASDGALLA